VFSKIMVALDGSGHAERALEMAISLAQRCDAELVLFHAIDTHPMRSNYNAMVAKAAREVYSKVGQEIADDLLGQGRAKAEGAGLTRVHTHSAEGNPAAVLIEEVKRAGIDMLVIGTRGLTGLHEIAVGSVAHKLTVAAPCPVLVVK
jgi:nucleotide-binding universal stress UspA family protein